MVIKTIINLLRIIILIIGVDEEYTLHKIEKGGHAVSMTNIIQFSNKSKFDVEKWISK